MDGVRWRKQGDRMEGGVGMTIVYTCWIATQEATAGMQEG